MRSGSKLARENTMQQIGCLVFHNTWSLQYYLLHYCEINCAFGSGLLHYNSCAHVHACWCALSNSCCTYYKPPVRGQKSQRRAGERVGRILAQDWYHWNSNKCRLLEKVRYRPDEFPMRALTEALHRVEYGECYSCYFFSREWSLKSGRDVCNVS